MGQPTRSSPEELVLYFGHGWDQTIRRNLRLATACAMTTHAETQRIQIIPSLKKDGNINSKRL
jgi:hypothetical protein